MILQIYSEARLGGTRQQGELYGVQYAKSGDFWHSRGAITPQNVHRTFSGAPQSLPVLSGYYAHDNHGSFG